METELFLMLIKQVCDANTPPPSVWALLWETFRELSVALLNAK